MTASPNIFPALRYRDPEAALAFLRDVFGLTEVAAHRNGEGAVEHAEMQLEDGSMVMFGPGEPGMGTASLYAVVGDLAAHHARARDGGADIVEEPTDRDYGSREYQAKDPGGHVWCFGTYDPFAAR